MKIDKSVLMKTVGERVRKVRMAKGYQQNQLAKEFGCVASKITSIEKGTRDPGVDFYYWFAKKTGCSLDYIISGKADQSDQAGGHAIMKEGLKEALFALIDSFIGSDEHMNYMVERQLVPEKFEHKKGELTPSEIELINDIREMSADDAIAVMRNAKRKKR